MQSEIDQGLRYCAPCNAFGYSVFCGACGERFHGRDQKWRRCPNKDCQATVATDYCSFCGTLVAGDFLKRMERGEVDWLAESKLATSVFQRIMHQRPDLQSDLFGGGPSFVELFDNAGSNRQSAAAGR